MVIRKNFMKFCRGITSNTNQKKYRMAKLTGGIFGEFRGRIGNVVGVKRDGQYYIRSAPGRVKNPKTEKQQRNRNKFGAASTLASRLKPFIKTSFSTAEGKSWRGACISFNMRSAIIPAEDGDGYEIDFSNLIVSTGVLKQVKSPAAKRNKVGNIHVEWSDNSGEGNAKKQDRVLLLALDNKNLVPISVLEGVIRQDSQAEIILPDFFKSKDLHVYLSVLSHDEAISSESLYLGEIGPE